MARKDRASEEPPGDLDRAFAGAVQGADVYRAVRGAVRRHGDVLRIGNRFVRADAFREIAFVALGRAAVSAGFALGDALGDALTQGYLAGPDEVPEQIPFLHRRTTSDAVGSPDAEPVVSAVLELARGLTERDLIVLVLSPGALGLLAVPPGRMGADAYRSLLERLRRDGASGPEIERFVRATAEGLAGGRLLPAIGRARLLPLVVARGGPLETIGGGPTRPVEAAERTAARALLRSHGFPDGGPAEIAPALDAALSGPEGVRPVLVAGPSDALQGAGDALSDARWWSRLASVALDGGPEAAAQRFTDRIEEVLREVPKSRERRRGIAIFAGAPLDLVDGAGEIEAVGRLTEALRGSTRRRELTFAAFRTAGHRPSETGPGTGTFDPADRNLRPLRVPPSVRPGITDVGVVVMALRPEPPRS